MRLVAFLFATIMGCLAAEVKRTGPFQRIDINNATPALVETLPGIGPKLALEIIKGRPYKTIDELDRVKGIGAKKLEMLRARIFIGPITNGAALTRPATNAPPRIDINSASQEQLETLPGIGPKRAEAIIAGRPYRKVEELANIRGLTRAQIDKIKPLIIVR